MFEYLIVLVICSLGLPGGRADPNVHIKDLVKVDKYSKSMRQYVAQILRAVTLLDTYNSKVTDKIPAFNGAADLIIAVFEALAGLRSSQGSYSYAMRENYSLLRKMKTALRGIPDIIANVEDNGECQMDGIIYSSEDCESCKSSIPSFTLKKKATAGVNKVIAQMKSHIPNQFLCYINDMYVILVEGIRIIDKLSTCLDDKSASECDTKDETFDYFSLKMREILDFEKEHEKLVMAEKTKVAVTVDDLTKQVKYSLSALSCCLRVKNGTSLLADMDKDLNLIFEAERVKVTTAKDAHEKLAKCIEKEVSHVDSTFG